jgi:uncharacterized protein YbjQ (UPF0145 family)
MIGLNLSGPNEIVLDHMITTSSSLVGFEINKVLGIVEGVSERSFPAVGVAGIGIFKGGEMDVLMKEARGRLARAGAELGANAIVGFTYALVGREVEKSAAAYGTAVLCRKLDVGPA